MSKKNKTYTIIGVVIVSLLFLSNTFDLFNLRYSNNDILSFSSLQEYSIDQASFGTPLLHTTLPTKDTLPTETIVPVILPNSFISGIFYGLAGFTIISTLAVYLIFKPKKWLLLLAMQIVIMCSYIAFEIVYAKGTDTSYTASLIQSTLAVSLITLSIVLLSTYYPFFVKRFMFKYERKIYTILSIAALFFFALNHFKTDEYAFVIHIVTFALLIATQYLMYRLSNNLNYTTYLLLIVGLSLFYSLCFMPSITYNSMATFNAAISQLKLLSMLLIVFNIVINYKYIKKQQKQHKENEVYISQYVMLLKNYHKLLVEEKHVQVEPIQPKEVNSLKDYAENLNEYLKCEYKLTDREIDVIQLIWNGKTNKEIANNLNITLSTTKYHISNIYLKLNVSSRPQVFALKDW
ncbi:MAG: helix-turn-helix transcriptional regulator [Flavobacteriaceae bacterium]|jgi:DNA-binding CsgD family transcriptional regulator|nr:helix-turn-helix transcriptional regulator [Flavobacteriaceae bacterium]